MHEKRAQHELWWSRNLGKESYLHNGSYVDAPSLETFDKWMGDSGSQDRVKVRMRFPKEGSFLDVGCGAAPEFWGLQISHPKLDYFGLDITPELVEFNLSRGIPCKVGSARSIPFEDNSFDIVHSRHVVEHMSDIETPLGELTRVAQKNVYVAFFMGPKRLRSSISLDNAGTNGEVYHNTYSRSEIRKCLKGNPKVRSFKYERLPHPSTLLLSIELN